MRKFLLVIIFLCARNAQATAPVERGSGASASGTGTAVSISVSALGIQSGDSCLAFIHANTNGITITDNNGSTPFTDVFTEDTPAIGGTSTSEIGKRVAGGSEPATYNWTLGTSGQTWTVIVRCWSGVHADFFDVTPSALTRTGSSADGTTAMAPTMTILTADALGIVLAYTDGNVTYSGQTNSYANEVEVANQSQGSYTRVFTSTGSSGTTAVTLSASNDWAAHQFALKPAVAGGAVAHRRVISGQ